MILALRVVTDVSIHSVASSVKKLTSLMQAVNVKNAIRAARTATTQPLVSTVLKSSSKTTLTPALRALPDV